MPSTVRGSHSGELAADVVIVGAGLAGLAAAHHLTRSGLEVAVLEAADRPGGRMATDEVDGFRLDRTLHLLNTAFPELHRTPGLEPLRLRPFTAGVLVGANGSGRPVPGGLGKAVRSGFRSTGGALSATRAVASAARAAQGRRDGVVSGVVEGFLGGFFDRAHLAAALARLAGVPPQRLLTRPEQPAAQAIAARGLPARTLRGRVRPLLAALLSDPALDTSSRCADLVLRSFVLGRLCLPEGGAGAVPRLLADGLPRGTVRTGVRAVSVSTTAVRTDAHGTLRCRAVLVATGARAAAGLLPGLRLPGFHPVTVLHHTAPAPPEPAAALRIARGGDGPVAHSAVVSAVDPVRAPAGRTLIASTVLGAAAREPLRVLDKESRGQLGALYGSPAHAWELVGAHHDPEAVPAMPVPHDLQRPVRVLCGLYVCGDHRETSSPQGALHSARRAARAVLQDFGLRPEPARLPVAA